MVLLVTAEKLASHLQRELRPDDLDETTAEQNIASASGFVETQTGMAFTPRTATLHLPGARGDWLPVPVRRPLRSVEAITYGGAPLTGAWWVEDGGIRRPAGWLGQLVWPPAPYVVTVTYGLAECPDDIKRVVYELAGSGVDNPTGAESEHSDDYDVRYRAELSQFARDTLTAYGANPARTAAFRR